MRVRVLLSGSWCLDDDGPAFAGKYLNYVSKDYSDAVYRAGALPLIAPIVPRQDQIEACVNDFIHEADALILTGGHDLFPVLFGHEMRQKNHSVLPERDHFDRALYHAARQKGIPVLGICRGFQLMLADAGAPWLQDLSYAERELLQHDQEASPECPTQRIIFEGQGFLQNVFGKEVWANSFHHLAFLEARAPYEIVARSEDGVIEAIADEAKRCYGVQFHPEMMAQTQPVMQKLFDAWIDLARK